MNRHIRALLILAVPIAIVAGVIFGANALYGDKSIATFADGSEIDNITFTRDGTRILCGRRTGVDVYDFATKKTSLILQRDGSQIARAYESADGGSVFGLWAATAQTKGNILDEWDIRTGAAQAALDVPNHYTYFFSADGTYAAAQMNDPAYAYSHGGNQVEVWDASKKTKVAAFTCSSGIGTVSFSSDDSTLAAGETEEGKIEVFDIASGSKTESFSIPSPLKNPTPSVAYTGDGRYLLASVTANLDLASSSGHMAENDVYVYDAKTYKLLRKIPDIRYLNVSPDGKYIIGMNTVGAGNDVLDILMHNRGLKVVELATGKTVMHSIQGHKAGIRAAAFSPDMKTIVTGGATGELKLWDFTPQEK